MSTRRATLIADLRAFAQERGFALEMTQAGIAHVPLHQGSMLATGVSTAVTTVPRHGSDSIEPLLMAASSGLEASRISGDVTR